MSTGGRKYGLWHLTSPPRRASLQPESFSNNRKPRTKSNGDIGNCNANENQSATLESKKPDLLLLNAPHIQRERSLNAFDAKGRSKKKEQSVRRSISDYATSSHQYGGALANTATTALELRQRLQKEQDDERKPLLTGISGDGVESASKGYGGDGVHLLSPSQPRRQSRQKELIANIGRANTFPAKAKFSVEQSVFIEEDDRVEANDICEPLPHRKRQSRIWTRFSQKRREPTEIIETTSTGSPGAGMFRPFDRSSRRQQKQSLTSSYSPTLTTQSSSHMIRSPEPGRSVTRGAPTADFDTEAPPGQRVHASRCELYTNRAILLCILSGFVLFFVGSISFVAYVLAEKSYQDGLNASKGSR